MIVVRRCKDPIAFASFMLPFCMDELKARFPSLPLTPEILGSVVAPWTVIEFFDTEKEVIVGAAALEPNDHVHLYVDSKRRASWKPHTSLQLGLDIFFLDRDIIYANIPETNRVTISVARKLGFRPVKTENGICFHVLTPETRIAFRKNQGRPNSEESPIYNQAEPKSN
jgi:hypothetical protein